jgi:hypothetical protein
MTRSLLPAALVLVLALSWGAALILQWDPSGSQAPEARIPADVAQALSDERPSADLSAAELEARVRGARAAAGSNEISPEQRATLRQQIADDRGELRRRAAESKALIDSIPVLAVAAQPPAAGAGRPAPAAAAVAAVASADQRNRERLRLVEMRRRAAALRTEQRRRLLGPQPSAFAVPREQIIDRR